jgi:hypothetical protein
LPQQGDAAHDHSGGAVSALEGLGVEESLLDWMEAAGLFEPLDRGDRFTGDCGNWSDARTSWRVIA